MKKIEVICAGRTDAGVHAKEQVVHFETSAKRPLQAWTSGVNSHLPKDIAIKWAKEGDADFHARYSAKSRAYEYVILNQTMHPAIGRDYITWYRHPLDERIMQKASLSFIGEHDFSSFRSADCQSKSPVRNLQELTVKRKHNKIILTFKANAFLHHMIRNIVGTLLEIGSSKKPISWAKELLDLKDRKKGDAMAPPNGLFLSKVEYS